MNNKIKVLIIEDNEALSLALCDALQCQPTIEYVNAVNSLESANKMMAEGAYDVYILDLGLPDGDGLGLISTIRQKMPEGLVMIYSIFSDDDHLFGALQRGAKGYVLKEESPQMIYARVAEMLAGGSPMSPYIARKVTGYFNNLVLSSSAPAEQLSSQEQAVLKHLALGLTAGEIADEMHISVHTVKTYIRRIYEKLEVNSKMEALQKVGAHRWV